eukprot:520936_1
MYSTTPLLLSLLMILMSEVKAQAYCTDEMGNHVGWSPTDCCDAVNEYSSGYAAMQFMGEIQCGVKTSFKWITPNIGPTAHWYTFNTNGAAWNNDKIKFIVDACVTNGDTHLYLVSSDNCVILDDHDGWGMWDQAQCEDNGNIFEENNPYTGGSIIVFESTDVLNSPLNIIIGPYDTYGFVDVAYEIDLQCDLYSVPSIPVATCAEREQLGPTFSIEFGEDYKIGNGKFENEILNNNQLLYKITKHHGHKVILSTIYEDPISPTTKRLIIEFGITDNLPQMVTIRDGITGNIIGGSDINEHFSAVTGITMPFQNMWIKITFETTLISVQMSSNNSPDDPELWYLVYSMVPPDPVIIDYIDIQASEARIDEITLYHDCSNSYKLGWQAAEVCERKQLGKETKSLLYGGESYDYTSIFSDYTFDKQYIIYKITAIDGHIVKLSKGDGYATSYWYITFLSDDSTMVTLRDGLDPTKQLGKSIYPAGGSFENIWVKIEWEYAGYLIIYISDGDNNPVKWMELSRTSYFLIEHTDTIEINSIVIESPIDGQIKDIKFFKECEFTYIYVDIYQCNDFQYGTHNLFDSFDFAINFIGDEAVTTFSTKFPMSSRNNDGAECHTVTINAVDRLRCFIKSDSIIGNNLVAINLNSISNSIVCIDNIEIFYTFSKRQNSKINIYFTNIFEDLMLPSVKVGFRIKSVGTDCYLDIGPGADGQAYSLSETEQDVFWNCNGEGSVWNWEGAEGYSRLYTQQNYNDYCYGSKDNNGFCVDGKYYLGYNLNTAEGFQIESSQRNAKVDDANGYTINLGSYSYGTRIKVQAQDTETDLVLRRDNDEYIHSYKKMDNGHVIGREAKWDFANHENEDNAIEIKEHYKSIFGSQEFNSLWRNYTFVHSINYGIILSDGGCEYSFYDKVDGVFIPCMESIKLY